MSSPIVGLIERSGAVRFDEYMRLALYHPEHGYYASGALRTGFTGHYVTSPEVTPAFGALWARAFEAAWRTCDEPEEFVVTEIGGGEGTFAASVSALAGNDFARALRYRFVEPIPELRARQERVVPFATWVPTIDDIAPAGYGCVFANEVLDNVPVRIVEGSDEGPMELWVEAHDGILVEGRRPADQAMLHFLDEIGVRPTPGSRFEVQEEAAALVRAAAGAIERGAVFFVDYGASTKELSQRPLGSLLCYSEAGVDDRPLERPGDKDITVHANWNVVTGELIAAGLDVAVPKKQRDFLEGLGARELVAGYRAAHEEALREGRGADAVRALSGRSAIAALLDEGGLGGMEVVVGMKR